MKTPKKLVLAACAAVLTACAPSPPPGGAASFRLSEQDLARHEQREARKAEERADMLAQPSGTMMYQHNEHGLFGRSSSSGVIQTHGPIQSYQTIGNMPVYPGAVMPVNPYPAPGTIQYVRDPRTGQLLPVRVR
ncbi:MAG: hypothetical protein JNG86_04835 [Verrucomicrobiaceae bacterium]|nr:hypothetical protein [Verrucomicrobiaceae bacterium]